MLRASLFGLTLGCVLGSSAFAQCRQALAVGLDVSGSVDATEYDLQIKGLSKALTHPDVIQALLSMPEAPVHLAVFEWSAPQFQRILLDWQPITDRSTVLRVGTELSQTRRSDSPPGTGLGSAMQYGAALLGKRSACWRHTLDISGDGKHNMGPHPRDVRRDLSQQALTINALVIGADAPHSTDRRQVQIGELSSYFNAWVITGPDAFVETALGFEDYGDAMRRKLLRELDGIVLSTLVPD